jgi:hypothetical protein
MEKIPFAVVGSRYHLSFSFYQQEREHSSITGRVGIHGLGRVEIGKPS